MMTTDKIEIPQKVIDKLKSQNLELINYKVVVIGKGNQTYSNNNKLSIWRKTTKTISDYLNFTYLIFLFITTFFSIINPESKPIYAYKSYGELNFGYNYGLITGLYTS